MPAYPIRVPRRGYRGTDPRKLRKQRALNELADRLEHFVNQAFANRGEDRQVFTYAAIASELGLRTDQVREVMFAVDGGHNGITVTKE